jgi:hypothetical protein
MESAHGDMHGAHRIMAGVPCEEGGSKSGTGNECGDGEVGSGQVVHGGKECHSIVTATMGYNVLGHIFVTTEELEATQRGPRSIVSVNVMDAFGLCMPRHPDYTSVMVSSSSFVEQVAGGDFGIGWQAPAFNSVNQFDLLQSGCTIMLSPVKHAGNWILLAVQPKMCMVYIFKPQPEVSLQPSGWQLIETFTARLSRLFNTLQQFTYRDGQQNGSAWLQSASSSIDRTPGLQHDAGLCWGH